MSELDEQIRVYLDATSSPVTVAEVTDTAQVTGFESGPGGHRWVMVAAAVLVVLAAGLVALQFLTRAGNLSGDPDPFIAPVPPQPDVTSLPTTPAPDPDPSSTVEVTQPATEGSELEQRPLHFTSVPAPLGWLSDGTWFDDQLYAIDTDGALHATSNGEDWRSVAGFDVPEDSRVERLQTDGLTLIAVARSIPDSIGSVGCAQPGDVVTVGVLRPGSDWEASTIELPFTRPSTKAGCLSFWIGPTQVGPAGILVTASISGEVPFEVIVQEQLGDEALGSLYMISTQGNELVVTWQDGARTDRIDLAELGLVEEIADFAAYATDIISSPAAGDDAWGERPFAWWSADGQLWTQADRSNGPMTDTQISSAIATETGFVVTSDRGEAWSTTDGSTWALAADTPDVTHMLNDTSVVFNHRGVTPTEDGAEVLISADLTSGYELHFGALGVIGIGADGLLYSLDGSALTTWTPSEWAESQPGELLGIGNDFVVFNPARGERERWIGRLQAD